MIETSTKLHLAMWFFPREQCLNSCLLNSSKFLFIRVITVLSLKKIKGMLLKFNGTFVSDKTLKSFRFLSFFSLEKLNDYCQTFLS